jgi:uncharacterized protein (TIGR03067 family)
MFTMYILIFVGLTALAEPPRVTTPPEPEAYAADKAFTPKSLVGRYIIVSGEKEGLKEPEERIKGTTVAFTTDSVTVVDKDKKELYSASYKRNTTTNPCEITMVSRVDQSAGQIARGLIQKEGDTIRLIYALPTGEIPAGFKTKEKQLMFVLKKAD